MALDWPAFGDALWKVSDQLGIRPEWQIPVLSLETGGTFDPAILNSAGCVGIFQLCGSTYPRYVHVPVSEYRTWTASQQLSGPAFAYWKDALAFDKIRSSTRLMVAQLGQALLRTPASLDRVVFRSPSIEYRSNSGFDTQKNGTITEQDIANAMARQAASAKVKDAIAKAYAMRPDEVMRDPVYGDDYSGGGGITAPARGRLAPVLFVGAILGVGAAVWGLSKLGTDRRGLAAENPIDDDDLVSPDSSTPSEAGYVYHATNVERAVDIARTGLKPHRPWEFTDQDVWPDGGTEPRVYFAPKANQAWAFAPEEGKSVLLRTSSSVATYGDGTGDLFSRKRVPATSIEILTTGGWIPIREAFE